MYILELLFSLLKKRKNKSESKRFSYEPAENIDEKCEHIFLPIDSTKKVLACTKCGYILKITPQAKKNFFTN